MWLEDRKNQVPVAWQRYMSEGWTWWMRIFPREASRWVLTRYICFPLGLWMKYVKQYRIAWNGKSNIWGKQTRSGSHTKCPNMSKQLAMPLSLGDSFGVVSELHTFCWNLRVFAYFFVFMGAPMESFHIPPDSSALNSTSRGFLPVENLSLWA